jgi:23S rRNA-/tRNA-specific pseudouridylate synthase
VEPLLVHRLDATASGLLVFAKSEPVARALKDLFASHLIDRHYAAIVEGNPPGEEGAFESSLVESLEAPYRVRSLRPYDGEAAIAAARASLTRWRRRSSRGVLHALEVRLETGRKHQIRVHLAEAGCPIVGDELYGGRRARRLLLHAWVLGSSIRARAVRCGSSRGPGPRSTPRAATRTAASRCCARSRPTGARRPP